MALKNENHANSKVNVGLIGAGGMANRVHYPSLHEMSDVYMAAITELIVEKREATAAWFGIPAQYDDYREMIQKEELDAVYVLMPPHHLFDVVINCLKAGLHVFIEKPPALTAFQTASMARTAAENHCLTATGFNRRFIPALRQVKQRVHQAGRVTQAVSTFYKKGSAVYYNGAIDVITCDAVHAVDTLRWMAGGDVSSVASLVSNYGDVVDNSWNALVRFDNGAAGILLTNWNVGGRVHNFEIHGEGISAFIDPDSVSYVIDNSKRQDIDFIGVAGSDEEYKLSGFFGQSRHFIDCIKKGEQPETNFADAVKTMELVDRIKAAAF